MAEATHWLISAQVDQPRDAWGHGRSGLASLDREAGARRSATSFPRRSISFTASRRNRKLLGRGRAGPSPWTTREATRGPQGSHEEGGLGRDDVRQLLHSAEKSQVGPLKPLNRAYSRTVRWTPRSSATAFAPRPHLRVRAGYPAKVQRTTSNLEVIRELGASSAPVYRRRRRSGRSSQRLRKTRERRPCRR